MRVSLPALLMLASCAPSPSTSRAQPLWWQPGQTAYSAPTAPPSAAPTVAPTPPPSAPSAPSASGGTCTEVFGCYTRCTTIDESCVASCEASADPGAAASARALAVCTIQNQCADADCQQRHCGEEIDACASVRGTQPTYSSTPTAPPGGAHSQVYVGMSLTAGGLYDYGSHDIAYRVLFDDGTAVRMLPPTGLDGVDTATLRAVYSDMVGSYQVQGDRVDLQFGTFHEAFEVKADGSLEGIDHVAGTFLPVDSLDGATLDGSYVCGTATWGFQFTADGRFHADRDAMIMVRDRQGNILDALPEGSGSYRIANNTLTLGYDSGQVVYIGIATIVDRGTFPHPDRLLINTWQYHRG